MGADNMQCIRYGKGVRGVRPTQYSSDSSGVQTGFGRPLNLLLPYSSAVYISLLGAQGIQRGAADKQDTLTLVIRQSGLGRVASLDVMGR